MGILGPLEEELVEVVDGGMMAVVEARSTR